MMRRALLLLPLLCGLPASVPARAADLPPLAAHTAQYQLQLNSARGDVTSARGTMAFEVVDACDGWATRQRLSMTLTNRDGQDIEMVSDYATWESKDGTRLRFRMRQTTEGAVQEQVEGTAALERAGGPGSIMYTQPEEKEVRLPAGTLFPMAHTEAILRAAVDGKRFVNLPIFDGTGDKGVQDSGVAIAGWQDPQENRYPVLSPLQSGRVRIAFFDRSKPDQSPEYEVGMRYFSNGIADDLLMDFGEFVMRGRLNDLKLPDAPHC